MIPAVPPHPSDLPLGTQLCAGLGVSTVIADMDFETYSEAGYVWDEALRRWAGPPGASGTQRGLTVTGAARYAEHASTEVLTLSYDLKDGGGRRRWRPGLPLPIDLFAYLADGGLIEAWNVSFEHWIWTKVCEPRYGFPPLPRAQLRCAMGKARAFALPGALAKAGEVLRLFIQKDKDGGRLLDKFSKPRNPTKTDTRRRIRPEEDPADAERLYAYCDVDIQSEAEASSRIPDLTGEELEFWQYDQAINVRGVQIDLVSVEHCIALIREAHTQYDAELHTLTGGAVARASELAKLQQWLFAQGVSLPNMQEETIEDSVTRPNLPPQALRALQIRAAVGSASVKKVFAMANQVCADGRLHDLFSYHAARTGRVTGNGPQPTNLPKAGPEVVRCGACGRYHRPDASACPWCRIPAPPGRTPVPWSWEVVGDALAIISGRNLALLQEVFGDAMATISGCLRGLFISAPGYDLIASDYSAIEAVVGAAIAGEEWRLEVFRTHGKIYEKSASMITGIPFEEFMAHKERTGSHHPMRNKLGKYAELASGFGGWINAWKKFGADKHLNDEEIKDAILKWRAASPAFPEMWGGQFRGLPWETGYRPELYGLEGMAVSAVLWPGETFAFRGMVSFLCRDDILFCTIPSGRTLHYHRPRLTRGSASLHADALTLSYEGYNTNALQGAVGWVRMDTYSGKLTENVVQATARDILRFAIINLERAGYPVVLHVYDEIVVEVPEGWDSVEEVERIMATVPPWATGWPIKAAGGWRAKRYRKD